MRKHLPNLFLPYNRATSDALPHMATPKLSPAFEKAAEISRNDKSGTTPTAKRLRGYGLYKVATAQKPPAPEDCPSVMNVLAADRRQMWFAHEEVWKELDGDFAKAEQLYIAYAEEIQGMEPGSIAASL